MRNCVHKSINNLFNQLVFMIFSGCLEVERLGGWEARRLGSLGAERWKGWDDRRLGSLEAERQKGWEAWGDLGGFRGRESSR